MDRGHGLFARYLHPDNTGWQKISGGEGATFMGRRAAAACLCRGIQCQGDVILLDEPASDPDVDTLHALEDALTGFAGCAAIISHDRWFLDRLATHILAFEGDRHVGWFEGNFEAYQQDKRRRLGPQATEPHRIKYRPLVR